MVSVVARMAAVVALARILAPADFGVHGSSLSVVMLLSAAASMGFSANLIHVEAIDRRLVGKAIGVAGAVGVASCLALAGAARWLAPILGMAGVSEAFVAMSVVVALRAYAAVDEGLLMRAGRFGRAGFAEACCAVVGGLALPLALGLQGYGFAALIWGSVVGEVLRVGLLRAFRPAVPDDDPRVPQMRSFMATGLVFLAARSGNIATSNLDNILVGALLGPRALGVYSRVYQLVTAPVNMFSRSVSNVLFSSFAGLREEGAAAVRARLLGAICLTSALFAAPAIVLVAYAEEVVAVALGPGWEDAVLPLRIMACVMYLRALRVVCAAVLKGVGAIRWNAVVQWAGVVVFVAGVPAVGVWGVPGMAGLAAAGTGSALALAVFALRGRGLVGLREVAIRAAPATAAFAVAGTAGGWLGATVVPLVYPGAIGALAGAGIGLGAGLAIAVALGRRILGLGLRGLPR